MLIKQYNLTLAVRTDRTQISLRRMPPHREHRTAAQTTEPSADAVLRFDRTGERFDIRMQTLREQLLLFFAPHGLMRLIIVLHHRPDHHILCNRQSFVADPVDRQRNQSDQQENQLPAHCRLNKQGDGTAQTGRSAQPAQPLDPPQAAESLFLTRDAPEYLPALPPAPACHALPDVFSSLRTAVIPANLKNLLAVFIQCIQQEPVGNDIFLYILGNFLLFHSLPHERKCGRCHTFGILCFVQYIISPSNTKEPRRGFVRRHNLFSFLSHQIRIFFGI